MKTKKFINNNMTKIVTALIAILMVLVAIAGIIEIPNAMSKEDTVEVEQTRYEEVDSFVIKKMEMTTCFGASGEYNNYYISFEGQHVVFMAEVGLEQYIYYNVGDTIPGTLIVENESMNFELDEFGKSFVVLGYVGLSEEN